MPAASSNYYAQVLVEDLVADYIHASATTVLLYHTLLSFHREVHEIWSRGHVGTTCLYLAARYGAIANRLAMILTRSTWKDRTLETCGSLNWLVTITNACTLLAIAAFSAIRVYALSDKKRWYALIVLMLGLCLPAVDLYLPTASTPTPTLDSFFGGCAYNDDMSLYTYKLLAIGSRIASFVSDLLALIVTLRRTYGVYVHGRECHTMSYSRILLVNGVTYFCVLSILNFFDVVFLVLAINGALADLVTTFSVILLSQFLLDLCEAHETTVSDGSSSKVSSLCFQVSICGEDAQVPLHIVSSV